MHYRTLPIRTTIEGAIVNEDNVEIAIEWLKTKITDEFNNELEDILTREDVTNKKYRVTIIRCCVNGKLDILKNITENGVQVDSTVKQNVKKISNIIGKKTGGWIQEFIEFYFQNYIDTIDDEKKKYDKFKVFYISYIFALLLGIVRFIAGYENMMVYVILNALGGIPLGIAVILQYQFTPDCYEYGQYKTGLKMRGVTFAAQTFFTKLSGAIATAVSVFALTIIGFREGEGVVQAAGFADKLWTFSCLGSIIGGICTLLILRLYKLNDHDVQLMAKCNNGEISREEAEAQMINQY